MKRMKEGLIQIIIADDNAKFIEGLLIVLSKKLNYKVIATCSDGEELVAACRLRKPDLVFTDIDKPVVNGFEAVRQIRKDYTELPIVALTMHEEEVVIEKIKEAGVNGYVFKPRASKEIHVVIDQIINKKK